MPDVIETVIYRDERDKIIINVELRNGTTGGCIEGEHGVWVDGVITNTEYKRFKQYCMDLFLFHKMHKKLISS